MERRPLPYRIGPFTIHHARVLGAGSFATVYAGEHALTGDAVAIKVFKRESGESDVQRELDVLKHLKHPNVVTLLDVLYQQERVFMVFEYCDQGDFSHFLKKQPGRSLAERDCIPWLKQLASGLSYLHSKDILHRDLKPQNLLLTTSPIGDTVLKLGDFGFARFIEEQAMLETICGTPLYMAPEIQRRQPYTRKSDLWSVGCIFYEMLTGVQPYQARSKEALLSKLTTDTFVVPPGLSPEGSALLKGLLQKEPKSRISWSDFFAHPWFADLRNPRNDSISPLLTAFGGRARSPSLSSSPTDNLSSILRPRASSIPVAPRQFKPGFGFKNPADGSRDAPLEGFSPLHARGRAGSASGSPRGSPHGISGSPHGVGGTSGSPHGAASGSSYGGPEGCTPPFSTSLPIIMPDMKPRTPPQRQPNSTSLTSPLSFSSSLTKSGTAARYLQDSMLRAHFRPLAVGELGDIMAREGRLRDAFVLYEHCVHCLRTSVDQLGSLLQKEATSSPSISSSSSSYIQNALSGLRGRLDDYVKQSDRYRNHVDVRNASTPWKCANRLLMDYAMKMGRGGGVHEILREFSKSDIMYGNGLLLLEQVWSTLPKRSNDWIVVRRFIDMFHNRVNQVRQQLEFSIDRLDLTS